MERQIHDAINALGVFARNRRIRAWLVANDPKALAQCEAAAAALVELELELALRDRPRADAR